jgi:pilus assembly protein Flp/PilA
MWGTVREETVTDECHNLGQRIIKMTKLLSRFYKDESGATAIEYGLIAALIALAIMVGAGALGNNIGAKFNKIATAINTGNPTP